MKDTVVSNDSYELYCMNYLLIHIQKRDSHDI